jgi:O-antigen/teichoic acid export membrane protein
MAVVIAVTGFPLQPIMLAINKPQTTLWVHVTATVIYFSILIPLLIHLGLDGAGMAYLAYYVAWTAMMTSLLYTFLTKD